MIEVEGLRKQFGELVAVDGASFTATGGAIFGLLGPNGAGKSTTIGCISGLLKPDGGRVRILNVDVALEGPKSRERLGVVPQELALYEDLSARENVSYWGAAYGLRGGELKSRASEVLDFIALADRAQEPVKNFSGGMKRRLNFGCAIMHRPQVLLLDEPTAGVDPQSRVRLLEMVREQVAAGASVLYTTHYMEEAESICDELAIIDHGKLIAAGTLGELRDMVGERDILRLSGTFAPDPIRNAMASFDGITVLQADPTALRLEMREASRQLPQLFDALHASGAEVRETTLTQPSLETLFIKLTGKELRE